MFQIFQGLLAKGGGKTKDTYLEHSQLQMLQFNNRRPTLKLAEIWVGRTLQDCN